MTPALVGEKRYDEQTKTSSATANSSNTSSNEAALLTLALRLLERREQGTLTPEATQLLVGQLPPQLPVEIPLPEGSRILGSLIRSGKQIAIVLDTDCCPEKVLDFYRDRLQISGWKIPESYRLGSFEPVHATNYLLFCHGARGLALWVEAYRVQNTVTGVRLQLEMNPRHSPCHGVSGCDRA